MPAPMVTKSFLIAADEAEAARLAAERTGVGLAEFYRSAIAARVAGVGQPTGRSPEGAARDEALALLAVRLEESITFAARVMTDAAADVRAATKERRTNDEETLERFRQAAKIVHDLNVGLTRSLERAAGGRS